MNDGTPRTFAISTRSRSNAGDRGERGGCCQVVKIVKVVIPYYP
jgi:hypothetical protein